jgi:hypothetical protein
VADRVVLHVGVMKSGTTTLQALLFANQDALAGQGLLVPGRSWGDQARAVTEVARTWRADGELWSALAAETAAWPGPAVVSMEYLGPFDARQVSAVVDSFGDVRVEVVLTVRDLNRSLASMWQETVRNGRSWTWSDYLAAARAGRPRRGRWAWLRTPRQPPEAGRTFWRQQDVVAMVRGWGAVVGKDHVTVVTVPPPGAPAEELTDRFAAAVGFSATDLVPGASENTSLGLVSAVLLQRVNALLEADGIARGDGRRFRKRVVARQVLGARAGSEPRIGLPVAPWVVSYAARAVQQLAAEVTRLEGTWADLTPVDVPGGDPARVDEASVAAAAQQAFTALRDHLTAQQVAPLPAWPAGSTGEGAVAALAGLVAAAVRAGARA